MCSMVSGNNSFHLEWNNHLGNMQAVLETLYTNQSLVDVTIACRDGVLKAHKVILSACSPYFEAVFRETPCKHPVLILKGVNVHEMQALLRFMYRGQVDVPEAELSAVIATACEFKVKGFSVDGLPGVDDFRPDSASEHESEIEAPLENIQPRISVRNWKDDKKTESPPESSNKLNALAAEVDVTPVIVESQSLQKSPGKDAARKDEDKEQEEADEEGDGEEDEEDKKQSAEAISGPLETSEVDQPEGEESAVPSPNANASGSGNAGTSTGTSGSASASGSTDTNTTGSASAPIAGGSSNSSSGTSNSNSPAVSSSVSANNGEATPYRRETRYKGQKRVDVGIRPAAGRARSVDKRDSSGGAESRSTGYGSSHSAKKLRMTALRKSDLGAVPEHPLPSLDRAEEKKLILESPAVDISITRAGSSMLEDGPPPFVKIKEEVESEDEDDEEATADMFCIPHLQELPDTDGADASMPGEEVDIAPRWSVHAPPPSASGREQRTVVEAPAEEGEGDMACPYCFTRCPRFSDLKRHMRLHTEDKPHECEFCSLAFARASHLARHRRTHTGERPFRCPAPSCERTFSRQDKLKLHTQRAHPGLPCDLVQSGTFMRIRGRKRIRDKNLPLGLRLGIAPSLQPPNSTGSLSAASSSQSAVPAGPAVISLPFGDTSYLTSLSLGQQRYSDLTISPITASSSGTSSSGGGGASSGAGAEELLKSVRQLGECTIQTLPSKVLAE